MFYRWKSDNVTGKTREHWSKVALEYLVQKGCATNRDVQSVLRQVGTDSVVSSLICPQLAKHI